MISIDSLHYGHGGKFYPIPEWARFFFKLGSIISRIESTNDNITLAIAVPTRAFVSAFIGLGITVSRAEKEEDSATLDPHQIEEPGLTPGQTEIIVNEGGKKKKRIYCGLKSGFSDGITRVGILNPKEKGGALTVYILPGKCDFTTSASGETMIAVNQSGRSGNLRTDGFVGELFALNSNTFSLCTAEFAGRKTGTT